MTAQFNRMAFFAIFALLLGVALTTTTGCPASDDDDSAGDDDDSAAVDDDDSAEQSMVTVICFIIVGAYMLELRRQINEISEEVSKLHKDFLAEVYMRYGEDFDGKK